MTIICKNSYHFYDIFPKLLYLCATMKKILKVDSPNDFARFVEAPVLHPLMSVIHFG